MTGYKYRRWNVDSFNVQNDKYWDKMVYFEATTTNSFRWGLYLTNEDKDIYKNIYKNIY